ncbi:WAS/WASL-interacting protein family member 1-like [Ylistrum balloti]|uniref:WAS/WASL-interacting protein family member 1-like n=1 Tax=Ylistrum balloti TaxID=509963 RepID=UPI0029059E82|nr:WAS/WASL-interacting protein family member 1-like [Ylistrum balloti]
MPSTCMMSASKLPPPLPARGNLPPIRKGGQLNRTSSAIGRPLPTPPKEESSIYNNAQTLPSRNKKSPVINYENHEIGMTKIKSLPAEVSKMTVESAPPPPPSRPPKRHSVSNPGTGSPTNTTAIPSTGGLDTPPALPSRGPPRRPSTTALPSPRSGQSSDLESRFPFHDESSFPPPEQFTNDHKAYASRKGPKRRKSPDLPPM